jgi:hypothetical protein
MIRSDGKNNPVCLVYPVYFVCSVASIQFANYKTGETASPPAARDALRTQRKFFCAAGAKKQVSLCNLHVSGVNLNFFYPPF